MFCFVLFCFVVVVAVVVVVVVVEWLAFNDQATEDGEGGGAGLGGGGVDKRIVADLLPTVKAHLVYFKLEHRRWFI